LLRPRSNVDPARSQEDSEQVRGLDCRVRPHLGWTWRRDARPL